MIVADTLPSSADMTRRAPRREYHCRPSLHMPPPVFNPITDTSSAR